MSSRQESLPEAFPVSVKTAANLLFFAKDEFGREGGAINVALFIYFSEFILGQSCKKNKF